MEKIFVKGSYTILGEMKTSKKEFCFQVNISNKLPVTLSINPEGTQIESIQEVEVSEELLKKMEANSYDNLSKELGSELIEITSGVNISTRRTLSIIKYYLNQTGINEGLFSVRDVFWSLDGKTWKRINQRLTITMWTESMLPLNDDSKKLVQDFIDSDAHPFVALRHLHRARNEISSRHKWIDATIAAELAIKEFLIKIKPELETLMLEVPSPPLHKMYGEILNKYGGKPLPKKLLTSLAKGAEIRNKLLHRPQEEIIDSQQAVDYVSNVAESIKHLLGILYQGKHIIV